MFLFISLLFVLAGVTALFVVYRDKIEAFMPGWKGKLWHGAVALAGFASYAFMDIVSYLKGVDYTQVGLNAQEAAFALIALGFVGVLISVATKRATPDEPAA